MISKLKLGGSSSSFSDGKSEKARTSRAKPKEDLPPPPPVEAPLETLTVPQLKDALRCRGLKLSGKKDELVARLTEHLAENPNESDDYQAPPPPLHGRPDVPIGFWSPIVYRYGRKKIH